MRVTIHTVAKASQLLERMREHTPALGPRSERHCAASVQLTVVHRPHGCR